MLRVRCSAAWWPVNNPVEIFWTDPLEKGAQTGTGITSTSRERREPGPARPAGLGWSWSWSNVNKPAKNSQPGSSLYCSKNWSSCCSAPLPHRLCSLLLPKLSNFMSLRISTWTKRNLLRIVVLICCWLVRVVRGP